jgi:predicted  nucleic acid-binding Zn-ribbon protein
MEGVHRTLTVERDQLQQSLAALREQSQQLQQSLTANVEQLEGSRRRATGCSIRLESRCSAARETARSPTSIVRAQP